MKYREYGAETFTQDTSIISLRLVKVSSSDPSPISRYSESSKMTKFNLLGFSGMKP